MKFSNEEIAKKIFERYFIPEEFLSSPQEQIKYEDVLKYVNLIRENQNQDFKTEEEIELYLDSIDFEKNQDKLSNEDLDKIFKNLDEAVVM